MPGAEELIGQYELGMSATVRGDAAHNFVLRDDLRTSAVAGTTALAEFATGLLFYSAGKYPDADRWFVQAGRGSSVLADRGVMLRLFRGNVQLRIGRPAEARREFAAALDLQPDNARASVGLAESALLAGNGGCTKEKIDPTGVRTAVRLYQQAMRARVQPRESDVPVKVMSGLGRAYLCLSQAGVEDRWGPAREHLERVLQHTRPETSVYASSPPRHTVRSDCCACRYAGRPTALRSRRCAGRDGSTSGPSSSAVDRNVKESSWEWSVSSRPA